MIGGQELQYEILSSLDPLGWVLLYSGWFMYWLKLLDLERRKDTRSFFSVPLRDFLIANMFEIPISAFACLICAVLAPEIPPKLIDLSGRIAIFVVGYTGSDVLNSIMSYRKPLPQAAQQMPVPIIPVPKSQ